MQIALRLTAASALTVFDPHPKHLEFRDKYQAPWQRLHVVGFYGNQRAIAEDI